MIILTLSKSKKMSLLKSSHLLSITHISPISYYSQLRWINQIFNVPHSAALRSWFSLSPPQPPPLAPSSSEKNEFRTRADPFQYFRENNKALNSYLYEENRYVDKLIHKNQSLIRNISAQLSPFQAVPNSQGIVSEIIGSYQYWTFPTSKGPAYCRLPIDATWGPVSPFLNPEDFFSGSIKKIAISPSHTLYAYILEERGEEYGKLYIQSFSDPKNVKWSLATSYVFNMVFLSDHLLAYTTCNTQLRPDKVFLMSLKENGASSSNCIYHCNDGFLDICLTKDKKFLTINSNTLNSSEVRILDVSRPLSPLLLIHPRQSGLQYYVDHHKDTLYILTNADGQKNFKLVTAPTNNPNLKHWRDLYIPDCDEKIEDIDLFNDHLVLYLRHQGLCQIEIIHLSTGKKVKIPLGPGVSVVPGSNIDFEAKGVRINLRHPYWFEETVEFQFDTNEFITLSSASIPDKVFSKSEYEINRMFVPSRNSETSIPVTLLNKKNIPKNGRNPLLIHVYGAYGIPLEPILKESDLFLLKEGWVIAYAHVRGGSELGFQWHENGKLLKKRNSIHDLLDVCKHLIDQGYSHHERFFGSAVSAGALTLASAALYQPGLFRAIVLKSPFLDLLSVMMDPTLPLTETEFLEWGNPVKDPQVFQYMLTYSPYERLLQSTSCSNFPSLFMTASKDDQRTPIWQSAKFMALCRHRSTSPHFFKVYETGGHFTRSLDVEAFEILFLTQMASNTLF